MEPLWAVNCARQGPGRGCLGGHSAVRALSRDRPHPAADLPARAHRASRTLLLPPSSTAGSGHPVPPPKSHPSGAPRLLRAGLPSPFDRARLRQHHAHRRANRATARRHPVARPTSPATGERADERRKRRRPNPRRSHPPTRHLENPQSEYGARGSPAYSGGGSPCARHGVDHPASMPKNATFTSQAGPAPRRGRPFLTSLGISTDEGKHHEIRKRRHHVGEKPSRLARL